MPRPCEGSLAIYLFSLAHKCVALRSPSSPWRHGDRSSTGVRHHRRVLFNGIVLSALALLLGLDGGAIVVYSFAAAAFALWTHADTRLPTRMDRLLRLGIVTPAAHAFHHSAARVQADSNYGDVLTLWDRLFGTCCDLPQQDAVELHVGLGRQRVGPRALFAAAAVVPRPCPGVRGAYRRGRGSRSPAGRRRRWRERVQCVAAFHHTTPVGRASRSVARSCSRVASGIARSVAE